MHVNGMIIAHRNSEYAICLPDKNKTPICHVRFPHNDGDTKEEERVVKIIDLS